jgi:hypothetical protein
MPTAVYDASYITFRNRAKTLYAFNNAVQQARAQGNYTTLRTEQPTLQSAEIIITRQQGGCFCTNDAAGLSITNQGPGACSCAR